MESIKKNIQLINENIERVALNSNRKKEDIESLSKLQDEMIEIVKDYVKVGGHLIYSTCTIEKDENINTIKKFLKENDNFKLVNIQDKVKNSEDVESLKDVYIERFPHIHGTDGFFIAKMVKER